MSSIKLDKRPEMSVSSTQDSIPAPVLRVLKKLGQDLSLARRRRHLTQESMAERVQTSVATLRRMEQGDPRISIGTITQAFFVLGELDKIGSLLDTSSDEIGLSLMNQRLPQRVRSKRIKPDSGAQ